MNELKRTDMRLGNLIWWCHEESESIKVVDLSILEDFIYIEIDPDDSDERFARFGFNYAPILLTEEWLLKLGFERYEKNYFKININNGWALIWQPCNYVYIKYLNTECEISHVEYRYVHQLQNIYFALTGKELEVK